MIIGSTSNSLLIVVGVGWGRLGEGGSIDGLCMEMPNSWVVDFTQYLDSIKLTIASKLLLRSYGPNLVHAKAPI